MKNRRVLDFEVIPEWFIFKRECPTVSIVVPTYNRIEQLQRSVTSLCAQDTNIPYEVIVVLDGCTDGTLEWLERDENPIVRWAGVRENTRLPNRLLNRAATYLTRGEIFQHFFDDDKAYPNMVEDLGGVLMRCPQFDFSHAKVDHLHGARVLKTYGQPADVEVLARENTMPLQGVFVRRRVFLEMGGFDEHEIMAPRMDWDLVVRLALKYKGVFVDRVVSAWCPESEGILLSYWQGDQEKVKALETYRVEKWHRLGVTGAGIEYTG